MTRRPRTLIAAAALLVAVTAVLLGGALTPSGDSRTVVLPDAEAREAHRLTVLGLSYQSRARGTGDPSFYGHAEQALRRSIELRPADGLTLTALAGLAASRHRFADALTLARRAVAANPSSAEARGLLGDALLELGRYRAAFAAFDRSVSLKPTAAGYARISYARELLGRTGAAKAAMRMAVGAAGPVDDEAAWALVQLGNLDLERGRLGRAERSFAAALARSPGYAPALAGRARAASWEGRDDQAARLFGRALAARPLPEFAVGLGDVLLRLGRQDEAERAFRRAERLEDAFAANGGANELETALFDLDHGRRLADALVRARVGRNARPSVEGEHVLAWALYHDGRCVEARRHSVRALRLGTKDWGAMIHRSLIERCLGNERSAKAWRARALEVNPYALVAFGPVLQTTP